jgi:WD40 repeat protein
MDAQDAGGEMHFSADGSLLGYADLESGVAHIWSLDPALGKKGPVLGHPDATAITAEPSIKLRGVSVLAFGRRGRRQMVATGGGAGFQLFEITMTPHGPVLTRLYELPHTGVTSLLFSADGKHLAEGNQDGHVRIFAVPKNLQFRAPVNETGGVDTTKLDMSEMRPDFQQVKYYRVAPATDDIWVEQEIDTEAGPVRFLAFSPDDGLLATASDHSEMRTWKLFRDYHKLAASGTVTGPWPLAPLDGMILAGCTDLDTYIEREAQETHVSRDRNQVLSDVDFGRLASGCRSFLRRRASIEKEPAR